MDLNENSQVCIECGELIIKDGYKWICNNCGLESGESFGESSFLYFDKTTKRNQNKQYVALGKRNDFIGGLGSFIDFEGSKYLRDAKGKPLRPEEQKKFRRLKKSTDFIRIKDHETEYRIFKVLAKISTHLNLNKNTKIRAAYCYRKIIKSEGKVINNISLIAFCIYYATVEEKESEPLSIFEIVEAFNKYGYRVSAKLIIRDGLLYKKHLKSDTMPHRSEVYLTRLIDKVINHEGLEDRLRQKKSEWSKEEFNIKITKTCRELLTKLTAQHRGGRSPFILTGAVIYTADRVLAQRNDQKAVLTQKIISEATGIAEYSIRDHYVHLLKRLFIQK